jgi:hypothetical protein
MIYTQEIQNKLWSKSEARQKSQEFLMKRLRDNAILESQVKNLDEDKE